jgi:hypothetical protein
MIHQDKLARQGREAGRGWQAKARRKGREVGATGSLGRRETRGVDGGSRPGSGSLASRGGGV